MGEAFEEYLRDRSRRGPAPDAGASGSAGGSACGDLVRISVVAEEGRIQSATFDAEGCAATVAAASAATALAEGASVLDAARIGVGEVDAELGGLSLARRHAAELAADALHGAIGALAARADARLAGPTSDRVLVALSGGVDSAVAALLEREAGRDVVAVTVKLWADPANDGSKSCCSPQAVISARALAHSMGLPHFTLDLQPQFRASVVDPFLVGHAAGVTPNPCVRCNGEVRIDAMLGLADRVGAERLATGHYARTVDDGAGPLLTSPADPAKDQTYMLSAVSPESLARLSFPLAGLTKLEVRRLAEQAGLEVARKPESQDLCFLAGEGKRGFLRRHGGLEDREGRLVDRRGRTLGTHPGHHHFTVGQRRGIGVAAREPLYVLATDADANSVTVGTREELASSRVTVRGAVLHRDPDRVDRVRLRYHSRPLACRVLTRPGENGELAIELEEPCAGVAPGQTASLLDGELIVGHATIAA